MTLYKEFDGKPIDETSDQSSRITESQPEAKPSSAQATPITPKIPEAPIQATPTTPKMPEAPIQEAPTAPRMPETPIQAAPAAPRMASPHPAQPPVRPTAPGSYYSSGYYYPPSYPTYHAPQTVTQNPYYAPARPNTAQAYTPPAAPASPAAKPYAPAHEAAPASSDKPADKAGGKKKRTFGLGSVIAVAVIASLLCGILSSAMVAGFYQLNASPSTNVSEPSGSAAPSNGTPHTVHVISTDKTVIGAANTASASVVGIRVSVPMLTFWGQSTTSSSEGSGVVYTADGYIITNYHVISDAVASNTQQNLGAMIEVFFPDDSENAIPATIVGYDSSTDLAVLKIDRTGLTKITIGNSDELVVGEQVIAIGNPGGLEFMGSVSTGIISGLNRKISTEASGVMSLIQTDAAINPGNSGGALVDMDGALIGINNSKMAGDSYEGMGFAIPVNEVVETCDRLIKNENQPVPFIGITANSSYDSEMLNQMGMPSGVVIYSVTVGSPADDAGLRRNDIITHFNGKEITSYNELDREKKKCSAGDTVSITYYRDGQSRTVELVLGASS